MRNSFQALEDGEAGVDEAASLAPLGAFLVFGFQQGGQVGQWCLLLPERLVGQRSEAWL